MTNDQLTRERLQEIAEDGFLKHGESKELARIALAAMDSEPVAWVSSESLDSRLAGIEAVTIPFVPGMDIPLFRRPVVTHNGDCDTDPFGFARRSGGLVVIDVNGDPHIKDGMPLYRHAQPAPVVMDERAAFNAWNNEDNLPIAGVGAKNAAWLAWQARAMLQAGNSPVIPDGYVMVPKEPTEEMLAAAKEWTGLTSTAEVVYIKMLAAAPQEVNHG